MSKVGVIKRLSVLACVLILPLWILGGCLVWLVDSRGSLVLPFLYFSYYGPLLILALLIVGGVCGRPKLTEALCGAGLAMFLVYVLAVVFGLYGVNSGLIAPYMGPGSPFA